MTLVVSNAFAALNWRVERLLSLGRRTGPHMLDRWTVDEAVDELEEEFEELMPAGRGRKPRKRAPVRMESDFEEEDRDDKRRKRRWEAPPHKRVSDYEPG
jgi:hypothetical protein